VVDLIGRVVRCPQSDRLLQRRVPDPAGYAGATNRENTVTEPTPPAPPATFTQEQLNAIIARESAKERDKGKADGIAAAQTELEKSLGMSVTDVAAFIKEKKDAEDAVKTEAQKALDKANRDAAAAAQTSAEAKFEVFSTRAERYLLRAGLAIPAEAKPEVVAATLGRVRGMLTVGADADEAAIAADVETLKAAFPALFTPATTGPPPPPGTDPKRKPGTPGTAPTTGLAAGVARAKAETAAAGGVSGAWGRRPS